ncbi:hypothetical protein RI367_006561 [Sorochytrium milnesiophthora]
MTLAANLARLPPEIVTHIVALAGARVCAVLQHLPALRSIILATFRSGWRSKAGEHDALHTFMEHRWGAGVTELIAWDAATIRVLRPKLWRAVTISASAVQKQWRHDSVPKQTLAALVYNLIAAGDEVDWLVQWCCTRSRRFAIWLGDECLQRGGDVDQLRQLCKQTGTYIDERFLAVQSLAGAAEHGRLDVIRHFDSVYPELVQESKEPLRRAATAGHLETVQYLCSRSVCYEFPEVASYAACANHAHIVEWIYDQHPCRQWIDTPMSLAQHGYLALLKRMWRNGHAMDGLPDLCMVAESAAKGNQLAVLEWLHQINPAVCRTNIIRKTMHAIERATVEWICDHAVDEPTEATAWALICCRCVDIVKWMVDKYPRCRSPALITEALSHGLLDLAQWLAKYQQTTVQEGRLTSMQMRNLNLSDYSLLRWIDQHAKYDLNSTVRRIVIEQMNLGCLQLLCARYPSLPLRVYDFTRACWTGNLPMAKWIYRQLDSDITSTEPFNVAAAMGRMDIVQWLHYETAVPCSAEAMDGAAQQARLDIVQFLHDHRTEGCTTEAMDRAACHGHHEVMLWLHANRTEGCTPQAMTWAARSGLLQMVQWLYQHYPHTLTPQVMDQAAENGWLDIVQHLHTHCGGECTVEAMGGAAEQGLLDVVAWLHRNRSEGCTEQSIQRAAMAGYLSVIQFLHANGYPMRSVWSRFAEMPPDIKLWLGPPDDGLDID